MSFELGLSHISNPSVQALNGVKVIPSTKGHSYKSQAYGTLSTTQTAVAIRSGISFQIPIMLGYSEDKLHWENASREWEIAGLIYSPSGIKEAGIEGVTEDLFGGNPPDWIYIVKNKENGNVALMGKDDARTLFDDNDRRALIESMKKEKGDLLRKYKDKITHILRLHVLVNEKADLENLRQLIKPGELGDRHFEQIDKSYSELESAWKSNYEFTSLTEFSEALKTLEKVTNFMIKKNKKFSFLTEDEVSNTIKYLVRFNNKEKLEEHEMKYLLEINKKITGQYLHSQTEASKWALRKETTVDTTQEQKTPAFHATLQIANLIKRHIPKGTILDIGPNLSNLWRVANKIDPSGELAKRIIEMEKYRGIWESAPNPNRILGDLSDISTAGLPIIHGATNDSCTEPLKKGGELKAVTLSFVLDQLTPEEAKNALIAIDKLLQKSNTQNLPSMENLKDYPALIIASPEHSPIGDTEFGLRLKENGYVLVSQMKLSGELTKDTKEKIRKTEGKETLKLVEDFLGSKNYYISVYAKTGDVNTGKIQDTLPEKFNTRIGQSRERLSSEEPAQKQLSVDPAVLYTMDLVSSLQPADFKTAASTIIPRSEIVNSKDKYVEFEDRLACLMHYEEFLNSKEKTMLDSIVEQWDKTKIQFLTKEQIDFVMDTSNKTIPFRNIERSLNDLLFDNLTKEYEAIVFKYKSDLRREGISIGGARLSASTEAQAEKMGKEKMTKLKEKEHTLWELYKIESTYRKALNKDSVFDLTRPFDVRFIKELKHAQIRLPINGMAPTLENIARELHFTPEEIEKIAERQKYSLQEYKQCSKDIDFRYCSARYRIQQLGELCFFNEKEIEGEVLRIYRMKGSAVDEMSIRHNLGKEHLSSPLGTLLEIDAEDIKPKNINPEELAKTFAPDLPTYNRVKMILYQCTNLTEEKFVRTMFDRFPALKKECNFFKKDDPMWVILTDTPPDLIPEIEINRNAIIKYAAEILNVREALLKPSK